MKVLISSGALHFTDDPTWSEGYNAYCLCKALAGKGVQLTILAPSASSRVCIDGARIIGMGKFEPSKKLRHHALDWFIYNLRLLAKARKIVRDTKPDLVHHIFPSWIDYGYSLYPMFDRERPFVYGPVLTPSNGVISGVASRKDSFIRFLRKTLLRMLYVQTLKRSSEVIVSVENAYEFLPHFVRDKSTVICHGVDTELFSPATPRREHSELKVVFIGRLAPNKGAAVAIRAVSMAKSKIPDISLQVIGVGPERAELESLARVEGVSDCVHFLGFIEHNQLPNLLRSSDVLCCPSIVDASPTVILEAMACGLPVIASNIAGIPEMLGHGSCGLLVKPSNPYELSEALVKLSDFPELSRELGRNGRIDAERTYDWNVTAQRVVEVYRAACAEEGSK